MVQVISGPVDAETRKILGADLGGYVKVVVDVDREIMTAGGKRHAEGEGILLAQGSKQENLWGGGIDLETGSIDFDSMINLRPSQGNTSREVFSPMIRSKMEALIQKFFPRL